MNLKPDLFNIMTDLLPLSIEQTNVKFYSPVVKTIILTRKSSTKTNSFYHSILSSYKAKYVSSSEDIRKLYVAKMKEFVISKIEHDNINMDLTQLNTKLKTMLTTLLKTNNQYVSIAVILNDLVPFSKFEPLESTNNYKKAIVKKLISIYNSKIKTLKGTEPKKIEFLLSKIKEIGVFVSDMIETDSYKEHLNRIKSDNNYMNEFIVNLISEKIKRNIIFINSKSRAPYRFKTFKFKKTIVLLDIDQNDNEHVYEIVTPLANSPDIYNQMISSFETYITKNKQVEPEKKVTELSSISGSDLDSDFDESEDTSPARSKKGKYTFHHSKRVPSDSE